MENERDIATGHLSEEKEKVLQLLQDGSVIHQDLNASHAEVVTLKKQNVNRRLKRKESKLEQVSEQLKSAVERIASLQTSLRTQKARARKLDGDLKVKKLLLTRKNRQIQELQEEKNNLLTENRSRDRIELKDDVTGHFTKDTVKCVIELIGEKEVSVTRVAEVIQTVFKHLTGYLIPSDDLPSLRSILRFSDKGHVISKIQVAKALLHSEHFDIHTDGTTKCGKKVVGQQVTTDDGTSYACGFSIVSAENTTTLMDVTTNLLQELTETCGEDGDAADRLFKTLLAKLAATMSDRAAVNKSFNAELNAMRKATLGTDEDIEFLHCNAHFLLGLANSSAKTLKMHFATPVGREKAVKFSACIKAEGAVSRFIREACGVLGPRGDERYSCCDAWLAFCSLRDIVSVIPSFKGNRFNNLFRAAASLHFHLSDLADFLGNYMTERNWKQDGIYHDILCDDVHAALVALGLGVIFFRIMQPYWQLLGKPIAYLDFYHVVLLHR